jgi:lipopolysaccharide/colanic/teichoic acid biosynthesis glycosyltransferase
MYRHGLKRLFDLVASFALLLLISPVLLFTALLIRLFLGAPVLFRQQRPGLHEKPFDILKFRSMTDARYVSGELKPDRERLTSFGIFLRKWSLDELPGLLNVLRGDMSLVGPRPLLMRYLPYYTERERLRHTVRPGITGLAQINGRNTVGWDQRLAFDVQYVENLSFALDCKIILKTIFRVSRASGVVAAPDTIMQDLDIERRNGTTSSASRVPKQKAKP